MYALSIFHMMMLPMRKRTNILRIEQLKYCKTVDSNLLLQHKLWSRKNSRSCM